MGIKLAGMAHEQGVSMPSAEQGCRFVVGFQIMWLDFKKNAC